MPDPPDTPSPKSPTEAEASEPLAMTVDPCLVPILEHMHGSQPPLRSMTPQEAGAAVANFPRPKNPRTTVAEVRELEIPGPASSIPARLYLPDPENRLPLAIAFHGGGWVVGDLDGFDSEARLIAAGAHCNVLSIDYRLAPEDPFPAAVEDAFASIKWASEHADDLQSDGRNLALVGMSAGGNIAAAAAIMARDHGIPGIRHQLLVYPVLDSDIDRPTMHAFSEGLVLEREDMKWFWNLYCPDLEARKDFRATPINARSLAGLPTTYLALAALDPLLDEALDYGSRLKAAEVHTEIRVAPGLIHGFFSYGPICPAAADEVQRAIDALRASIHGNH